jgi:hypothetical protein
MAIHHSWSPWGFHLLVLLVLNQTGKWGISVASHGPHPIHIIASGPRQSTTHSTPSLPQPPSHSSWSLATHPRFGDASLQVIVPNNLTTEADWRGCEVKRASEWSTQYYCHNGVDYANVGLGMYVGECMVSIINIDLLISKEPVRRYQICNTSQMLIFDESNAHMSRWENLCKPEFLFGLIPF